VKGQVAAGIAIFLMLTVMVLLYSDGRMTARVCFNNATCSTVALKPVNPKLVCQTDLDCVPAACCHSGSAVNYLHAPNCSEIACSMECRPGTLDCGGGTPACVNNRCQVKWRWNPARPKP